VDGVEVSRRPPSERADAARNRDRLLAAARKLAAEKGADALTVASVARAAGVGKATLIRRFGDKAGLIYALLDEHERELQDAIVRGRPPLGPGAPPRERIAAFLHALLALSVEHLDVLYASETAKPSARYRVGAQRAWVQHLVVLLGAAGARVDGVAAAHALLAPLAAEALYELQNEKRLADVGDVLDRMVDGVLRDARPPARARRATASP